jgi:hypothetical protein
MPELVTCPACGCKVQLAENFLGRPVRCFGCTHTFVAAPEPPAQPLPGLPVPVRDEPPPPREEPPGRRELVLCPVCKRPVGWDSSFCPYCGLELEPEEVCDRADRLGRRDAEPHRGALLVTLGNVSMIAGGLSLCLAGLGALVSVPTGLAAWVLAQRDLGRMRAGLMDPRGRGQTEVGRIGGIVGLVLGLLFAAFYAFVYLGL